MSRITITTADKWYSRWLRVYWANDSRVGGCVTCPRRSDVAYLQCGHFYGRTNYCLRFEPMNTGLQCPECNRLMSQGNGDQQTSRVMKFSRWIESTYGDQSLDLLLLKKNGSCKMDQFTLKSISDEYRTKVNTLLKEKGIDKWW